jgi:hypothetical protein
MAFNNKKLSYYSFKLCIIHMIKFPKLTWKMQVSFVYTNASETSWVVGNLTRIALYDKWNCLWTTYSSIHHTSNFIETQGDPINLLVQTSPSMYPFCNLIERNLLKSAFLAVKYILVTKKLLIEHFLEGYLASTCSNITILACYMCKFLSFGV